MCNSPFRPHDHSQCCGDIMDSADQRLKDGLRLTPVRRRTLEILLESHQAMGAYDVLERLAADGFGDQPPVAYRALEFLVENGLAHKINRLNAFAACMHPDDDHAPVFMICIDCKKIAEEVEADIGKTVEGMAKDAGFLPERVAVEIIGRCPACQEGTI